MWLFDSPKNYPDMLKKIAWTMFFVVLILLTVISQFSSDFSAFLLKMSLNKEFEFGGIKLYSAYFYIPLMFALLENIFKLHDKISDILLIRYHFDKNVILTSMLTSIGMAENIQAISKKNRDRIMSEVFYKYAGYNSPVIEPHNIYMALGNWSWFWIFLDTLLVTLLIGLLFLITNFAFRSLLIIMFIVAIFSTILILLYKFGCTKYAIIEVNDILSEDKRKNEVIDFFKNERKG